MGIAQTALDPPLCQRGKHGKKWPKPSWQASTSPPPPYGQCPYVNKTFQKAATKLDEFSEKCQRGGGLGAFSIQKFMLQILITIMKLIQKSHFRVNGTFFNNYIEKNQNKTYFEEDSSSYTSLRDGSGYQNGWIFGKVLNGPWPPPPPLRMVPISGNHVHALHTIWPSYLLAYMHCVTIS